MIIWQLIELLCENEPVFFFLAKISEISLITERNFRYLHNMFEFKNIWNFLDKFISSFEEPWPVFFGISTGVSGISKNQIYQRLPVFFPTKKKKTLEWEQRHYLANRTPCGSLETCLAKLRSRLWHQGMHFFWQNEYMATFCTTSRSVGLEAGLVFRGHARCITWNAWKSYICRDVCSYVHTRFSTLALHFRVLTRSSSHQVTSESFPFWLDVLNER
jgi:hypothetical protein